MLEILDRPILRILATRNNAASGIPAVVYRQGDLGQAGDNLRKGK